MSIDSKCFGIGFVILCVTLLVGIIGIFGYQLYITKEKVDISPATTNINQIQKQSNE